MPKRTNQFQRLVFLLKKQGGNDATVTESKLLKDVITGSDREVDVCVETNVASHHVIVSIECRDHKRVADVKWVEEMKAKHERLPTSLLILVSKKGFTSEANKVAKTYKIETLTYEETTEEDITRIFGDLDSLWVKNCTLTPSRVLVCVASGDGLPTESVTMLRDDIIYDEHGGPVKTIDDLVQTLLHRAQVVEGIGKEINESHKTFIVGWQRPKSESGESFYLQKLDPPPLRRIESIEVTGTCSLEVSEFPLRIASLGDVQICWGPGEFMGKDAILLASKDKDGIVRISIDS